MIAETANVLGQDPLATQLGAGAVVAWVIQKLKEHPKIPGVQPGANVFNRTLGALAAAAVTAGIGYGYEYSNTVLTITLSGITIGSVVSFLWHTVIQYAIQEGWYGAVLRR